MDVGTPRIVKKGMIMKTVVITGSARGLGFELAKNFRKNSFNVVLSDINEENLNKAVETLKASSGEGAVIGMKCDVTKRDEVEALAQKTKETFETLDIWVNNAGVNQSSHYIWDLPEKEVDFLINVDLKGAVNGSVAAMNVMIKQGFGAIYNVEGFGSNDAYQPFLVMYGTAKRAVTYFTSALANEVKVNGFNIIVGKLSPGIMITDFLTSSNGQDNTTELSDKVKKVYNILGDYPDVIAEFLVDGMIKNKKNDKQIAWLTTGKSMIRFMTAGFNKRDFFSK